MFSISDIEILGVQIVMAEEEDFFNYNFAWGNVDYAFIGIW